MITQAIKGWLQKLFAWWPWKQSRPVEYQHVASGVGQGIPPDITSWPQREGTVPQSGIAPRLSTLENSFEYGVRPHSEVPDLPPLSVSASPVSKGIEASGEALLSLPTTQQRLEFLRYLIQRGIVNEGFEKKE